MVVVDDDHERQPPHAGHVHRFVEVAARSAAVTEQTDGHPRFAPQLECVRGAGGVRNLRPDRHAVGQILPRTREVAAALVAAPVEQALDHRDAADELRRVIAVGRNEHIVAFHRARHADADRFLAQRRCEGADLPGSLERDRLGVERARQHHGAVHRDERRRVGSERGQRFHGLALRVEELRVVDLEGGDGRNVSSDGIDACAP